LIVVWFEETAGFLLLGVQCVQRSDHGFRLVRHLLVSKLLAVACDPLLSANLMTVLFSKQFNRQTDVLACKRLRVAAAARLRIAPFRLILEKGFCHHPRLRAAILVGYFLQLQHLLPDLMTDGQDELASKPQVCT